MQESDDDLDPELKRKLESVREAAWRPIVVLGIVILFVWFAGFIPWFAQEKNWPWNLQWGLEDAGVFGDSFGFINSLMSSLALVGVIAAIWLQKQELVEQRKELIITQWELKKSAQAQRDSQKELAKQARINLQATILTALQGIEQSAANPVLYPQDEGKNTALFVDQLRQLVVVDILDQDGDGHTVTEELSARLTRWKNLTFTMSTCREARNWVERLINDGHDFKSGQRKIKVAPDDIDQTQYKMMLQGLNAKLDRLKMTMRECGQSVEAISEWVADANEKASHQAIGDLIDRLKSLSAECEKQEKEAMYLRAAMFA